MVITWQGYKFLWVQGGLGVLTEDIAGHVHSKNSYELHYIVGGKGILRTEKGERNLREGMFFVTGPGIWHEQITNKDDLLTEVHCYLQGSGRKTNDALASAFLEKAFFIAKRKKYGKYFLKIAEEMKNRYWGYESVVEGTLLTVLTEYARDLIGNYGISKTETTTDFNDRRFLQIEQEFMMNAKEVTLSSLAERIGLSERQTQRLLERYYGMNFARIKKKAISSNLKQ